MTQFPVTKRTDKSFIAQPKIDPARSYKSTPDSLRRHFKAFERKPSLGASVDGIALECLWLYSPVPRTIKIFYTRCSRRSGWDGVNFFSENNSENEIKVHLTCERCFDFFTSSFMEPSLLHQRGFLQRTQLSRVGPGHQSSMSLLRHWFPGPHSQTMEFGIHVSLENICRASSRRRCKYKCSLQNALRLVFTSDGVGVGVVVGVIRDLMI